MLREVRTAGLTDMPTPFSGRSIVSPLRGPPEWVGGYHSEIRRVLGCDRLEKTACQHTGEVLRRLRAVGGETLAHKPWRKGRVRRRG